MDGTTELILVVIGYPIAGNPVQFAAERALRSLNVEGRVLSFEVKPDDVATALDGLSVIGISGIYVASSLRPQATQWLAQHASPPPTAIDCLIRNNDDQFDGRYEEREWVDSQIARHGGENKIWLGRSKDDAAATDKGFEAYATLPANIADITENADVIVIGPAYGKRTDLDSDEWARNDGSTLVVDLTAGHQEISRVRSLGYRVLGDEERRIGTIQYCLHRWTGQSPSVDVIHDAIEEYFSV